MSSLYGNVYGLSVSELSMLHRLYEAHSTAEYLMENYGFDENKAICLGYEIRELMHKFGFTEEEAIHNLLCSI